MQQVRHSLIIVFVLLAMPFAVMAAGIAFPVLTSRVVDEAHLLDEHTKASIENALAQHESKTGDQIVVVSLNSLNGVPIEDYGYQLGRHWGIGQKGKNNGLLLIIAPNERAVRIEVGYGFEGIMTDAISHLIISRNILPYFKEGNYQQGILQGTASILSVIENQDVAIDGQNATSVTKIENEEGVWQSIVPLLFIFLIFIIIPLMSRRRRGYIAPIVFGGWSGGNFPSGGGGFSGGGGSFGGGGASGRW